MSMIEGFPSGYDFDDTRKVLSQLALDATVPGGISDVPTTLMHLAEIKGAHPAFRELNDNFQMYAAGGDEVFGDEGAASGLPIAIVTGSEDNDGILGQLLTFTRVSPVDPQFLEGIAYSEAFNGTVHVSIHPNDGGYAYPNL